MRQWTDKQRHEAAERARLHKPWSHSTGPRSALGKRTSSRNAYKHGRFTYEKQILRWYVRLAALRLNQFKAHLLNEKQKFENELITKWKYHDRKKPDIMAFYPYFKVHPLQNHLHKGERHPTNNDRGFNKGQTS